MNNPPTTGTPAGVSETMRGPLEQPLEQILQLASHQQISSAVLSINLPHAGRHWKAVLPWSTHGRAERAWHTIGT
jgi:hypothetical protein